MKYILDHTIIGPHLLDLIALIVLIIIIIYVYKKLKDLKDNKESLEDELSKLNAGDAVMAEAARAQAGAPLAVEADVAAAPQASAGADNN